MTTSSCQSEVVALAKGWHLSIFLAYFLHPYGHPQLPVLVSQDNRSTITLIEIGRPTSELTRHIEIRMIVAAIGYFWVKDLIERKLIEVNCCPCPMRWSWIAEFFTEPLQSQVFDCFRGKIIGTLSPYPPSKNKKINFYSISINVSFYFCQFLKSRNVGFVVISWITRKRITDFHRAPLKGYDDSFTN